MTTGPVLDTAIDGLHQVVLETGARLDLVDEKLNAPDPRPMGLQRLRFAG